MSTVARYARIGLLALPLLACSRDESVSFGDPGINVVPPSVAGFGGTIGGAAVDAFGNPIRLGELRTAAKTPPAISGGTMAVDGPGNVAVVADSDRDQIYVVDLHEGGVRKIKLAPGSEPGRVALEGAEVAHVALRGTGKIARIDLTSATLSRETDVCPHPRGVAFDRPRGRVVVACLDGQLVQFEAATHNEIARKKDLPNDLRDVLVGENGVEVVSRYRSAELLRMTPGYNVDSRALPRKGRRFSNLMVEAAAQQLDGGVGTDNLPKNGLLTLSPALVWRTLRGANGNVWMLHQQSQDEQVVLSVSGGYGQGGCATITGGKVSEVDPNGNTVRSMSIPLLGLTVDAAVSPDQKWIAVASPGGYIRSQRTLNVYPTAGMTDTEQVGSCQPTNNSDDGGGQITAVAFDDNSVLYAFSRDPAELTMYAPPTDSVPGTSNLGGFGNLSGTGGFLGGTRNTLPGAFGGGPALTRKATFTLDLNSARDTGHDLFHADVGQGLACASCHGEALDDAHVWNFEKIGARRTQNMRGGVLSTAPFHWDGDMTSINHLVDEVMTRRMGGFSLMRQYSDALGSWIDRQPALLVPGTDGDAVARGKTLFYAASTKCATCHVGEKFTNNQSVDVGTGGTFQVPGLLGLSLREPYMHNGCAKTLEERFTVPSCGGGDKHGVTSKLKDTEIADLVAYLKTL